MAILGSDNFNRVGSTLGGGWTELAGAPFTSNWSTNGSYAKVDATGWHAATLGGTEASDHFFSCWIFTPNSSNDAGLIWRYIDNSNFYFLNCASVAGSGDIKLFRRKGAANTQIGITGVAIGVGASTWTRITVRHIGNRIQVYVQNLYDTESLREGPAIDFVDGDPVTGSGPSGMSSSGNSDTGGGRAALAWNDFIARDGQPDTIYLGTALGVGEGFGTVASPLDDIQLGLNDCGLEVQSKLKFLTTTPFGDSGNALHYTIGHAGRWARTAYSFPTYDDANGRMASAGDPNLTIEGADGGRSVLQETRNGAYFTLRSDARGVVVRGFDIRLTGGSGSKFIVPVGGAIDQGFSIEKCRIDSEVASSPGAITLSGGPHPLVRVTLCYLRNTAAITSLIEAVAAATNVDNLLVRMNVFDGRTSAFSASNPAAIRTDAAGMVNVGDNWDVDHNTFLEIRSATTDAALAHWDPTDVDGAVVFQNNIVFGRNLDNTSHGIYLPAGAITGTITAHHNGYFRVDTPRAAQVTNGGNEVDSTDPAFVDPAASFTWQHTAGQGLLGEGTFAAIVIAGDFRPTSVLYVDTADDSNALLGVLDRGALQGYVLPPEPGPGGTSVPVAPQFVRGICPPDYCVRVTYDPGGLDLDLSNDLMEARPITQEKDIELRSYRANDIDLVIKDPDGRFILGSPNSIIEDVGGVPDWLSTPVTLEIVFNGTRQHIYRGFLVGLGARIGVADLRLGNRFESFVRKPVLANASGQTVSTDGSNGSQFDPPDSGSYLSRVIPNQGIARIETWTFRFLNATQFDATGSVTGFDGTGSTAAIFNSNSGAITVAIPFWVGVFAANDKVTVKATLRIENTTTVQLLKTMLTSPLGADLDQSELDPSIDAYLGTAIDQPVFRYVLDSPTTVLEALENIGLHMLATVIEKADARIGLSVFVPSLSMAPLDMLCSGSDLIDLVIDTAPFYNFFVANFDWDEKEQEFTETRSFPADPADNDSQIRYDRLIPAPRELNLRAFNDTNVTWVQAILNQSYVRWSIPRPLHKAKLKVERMNMELDDIYVLDSLVPMTRREVEPFKISKDIDTALVEADLASADWYLQGPTECGYMFYDVGHRYDDCWFYF